MNSSNNWDQLSNHFDVYRPDANAGVVANLNHTWPALEGILNKLPRHSSILDFGCGTGALCNKLHSMGFDLCGTDTSSKMIEVARKNSPDSISYWVTEVESPDQVRSFALVTSSMVFQFVPDLSLVLRELTRVLKRSGIIWFSVHHSAYVIHPNNSHTKFENYSEQNETRTATIVLSQTPVTTYIRSADEYEKIFSLANFKKELEWYSEPYSDGTPAKYLVQAFRRGEE